MGVNARMADHPLDVHLHLMQHIPRREAFVYAPARSVLGWRAVGCDPSCDGSIGSKADGLPHV
jgi:hypothetical protein